MYNVHVKNGQHGQNAPQQSYLVFVVRTTYYKWHKADETHANGSSNPFQAHYSQTELYARDASLLGYVGQ